MLLLILPASDATERRQYVSILEYLLTWKLFDEAKYQEMYEQKVIAPDLKATKDPIIDDLNGVVPPLQRRMMKELLARDVSQHHILPVSCEFDY